MWLYTVLHIKFGPSNRIIKVQCQCQLLVPLLAISAVPVTFHQITLFISEQCKQFLTLQLNFPTVQNV